MRTILGSFLLLVGGALLALGIGVSVDAILFVEGSSRTEGVIRIVQEDPFRQLDNLVDGLYTATVTYTSEDGPELQELGVQGFVLGGAPYRRGDRVDVVYDPEQPTEARVGTIEGLWLLPALEGALGIAAILLGTAFLRGRR